MDKKTFLASAVVSELQSSDIFMSIKARLFDLKANLNGARVTEAFMDEIIANEDKYVGVGLMADIRGLLNGRPIGHMYDKRTGEFHSAQIGSFYHFEKEVTADGTYLVGYARVMKRNKAICRSLADLFAENALKFSFEITCGCYMQNGDELIIDADPSNYLEGMAVVTFPACEDAVAQELVAECLGEKGDEEEMEKKRIEDIVAENVEDENDEAETVEETAESADTETATVYVREQHVEVDEVNAYDSDTGEDMTQRVVVETTVSKPVEFAEDTTEEVAEPKDEDSEEVDDSKEEVAQTSESEAEVNAAEDTTETAADDNEDDASETEDNTEENTEDESEDENAACHKKQTAEQMIAGIGEALAALAARLDKLTAELDSMKAEPVNTTASVEETEKIEEVEVVAEEVEQHKTYSLLNPFMAELNVDPSKYGLLEKAEHTNRYSLLDRA